MHRNPVIVNTAPRRTPLRGALAWLLMLAVLFGQGLGAVHSISHGAPGAGGHAGTHAHGQTDPRHGPQATAPACDHGAATGLQGLFDHAPDEPGCRLYDQLLQGGPLMPVSTVLALPARTRTLAPPSLGVRLAAPAAVYLARGPPRA
jgi:hypothetical protein